MTYLDVNPMIVALRTNPNDFEMKRGWLHHFPSHHAFKFDAKGNVRIHAACDCAMLSVRPEQSCELWETYQQWHLLYWRPSEINREFASHFRQPNPIRRVFRRLLARLRHPILRRLEAKAPAERMIPAE